MIQNHVLSHMLAGIVRDFGEPVMVWQGGTLIGLLVLAWVLARLARRKLDRHRRARHEALRFGAESLDKALFPLLGSLLVWLAKTVLGEYMSTSLLELALVPLFGIGLLYIVFYLARRVFSGAGRTHTWLFIVEKIVTVLVWVGMVLTVLGIQDQVLRWMESVKFRVANERMTLLSLTTGVLWVCVTMVVALWLGSMYEERVMRSRSIDANLRVVLARIGRALLVLAAVLISFSLVGIDITVLGVFGGALGVGLGFGLQKIASNYVSGFIILIDRSLRIGDSINVGGLQGIVTEIRTRYTTVRGLDGIETLIPNERLITDVVQNHSSYLTRG
jgi:small-conductance mechanosensitive channel